MFDLALAIAHHLLIFSLFGILVAEIVVVRPGLDAAAIVRTTRVDLWYGIIAAAILAVGFTRAIFAAKGWAYYEHNLFFWAKIATFVLIGILSLPPTIAYLRWKKAGVPTGTELGRIRAFLWAEAALFALLPIFAAAMARGYGADAF